MLQTQKKRPDVPAEDVQLNFEKRDDGNVEERDSTPKDPTRYGDWEVRGRCIDF